MVGTQLWAVVASYLGGMFFESHVVQADWSFCRLEIAWFFTDIYIMAFRRSDKLPTPQQILSMT